MNVKLLRKLRKKAQQVIWIEKTINDGYCINDSRGIYRYNDDYFIDLVAAIKELEIRRKHYVIHKIFKIKPKRHILPF